MNRQHLSSGTRFRWQGVTYQVNRQLVEGEVTLEDMLTGAVQVVKVSILVQALFAEELHFLASHGNDPAQVLLPEQDRARLLPLSDYPVHWVDIARYRLSVIQPLLGLAYRTRAEVQARVKELQASAQSSEEHTLQRSLSTAALYRWIRDYTRSGQDVRALIPAVQARGGKGHSRLRQEVDTLANLILQEKSKVLEHITLEDVRYELAVRISEENRLRPSQDQLSMPSRATLARRMEVARLASGGLRTRTKRSTQDRQFGQTPYPDYPLERVEIDHTRSDLVVIDDHDNLPLGRLTLTYCLDLATRYPLGYYLGFEPPSYLTVMECLHFTICPKGDLRAQYGTQHDWQAYGIPSTLVIDNGKEFIGHDLEDACLLLGMVLHYSPVHEPQFKAGIERMFGSLNTMFFHALPGTTFSNPTERGAYPSEKQACVYLSEVDKLLSIFLLDIYAERFHQGLNGIPARRWEESLRQGFAPPLPPCPAELSILLSRTETRVLHPYGIEFASLRYNSDDLAPLRSRLKGHPTKIKYHPGDLSCLYAYDEFEQAYLRVPALDQEYTQGLSLVEASPHSPGRFGSAGAGRFGSFGESQTQDPTGSGSGTRAQAAEHAGSYGTLGDRRKALAPGGCHR